MMRVTPAPQKKKKKNPPIDVASGRKKREGGGASHRACAKGSSEKEGRVCNLYIFNEEKKRESLKLTIL